MGNFNAHARQVRNNRVSIPERVGAFHSALASYCALTNQKFKATCARFAKFYWITKAPPPTSIGLRVINNRRDFEGPDAQSWQLIGAIDALQRERNGFLHRLRRFEVRRIREKYRGRRKASKAELAALYSADFIQMK
jgi:hypothetical protein